MTPHFDALEIRDPADRERDLFTRLPPFLVEAAAKAPGLGDWLAGIDLSQIDSRERLAKLPVLRKPELMERQMAAPPFGGFVNPDALEGGRVFMSPGPIWEIQGAGADPWQAARALFAAGVRPGAKVHNAFAYHMTPGGFVLDTGARALGCTVLPAGTGNTDMQVAAAAALKPDVYCGTPDFLKLILDRAETSGADLSSFRIGLVSGGALFPSLREEYSERGIRVFQCYATAEFGVIAYETATTGAEALPGMVVNENLIVEIVRPGTDDPVPEGEVGEVVVTSLNPAYPLVRLGTGDLSAAIPGRSACGRTNMRLKGWMGRADQRTKVKGMFVDPKQIAELVKRHGEIGRARLVVTRESSGDAMTLHVEPVGERPLDEKAIGESLRDITKIGGSIRTAERGSLPADGKVIVDERDYSG